MNSGPALSARGLEFGFGSAPSFLLGVDLEVAPGEMVALIGPNGSGKTTLLKLLSWSLKPRSGEVRIMGDPAGSLSARERARRLALVPQQPSLAFPFTALEVILMGRAPYLGRFELEGARDLELAAEVLRATRLAGFERRRFHELSGGEKQRVMIAKALAQEPKVLLLDEPTAFLDLRHQVEVYELARKLSRERGLATLAASHDINLAAMFCDRIAALGEGRILAAGRPAEILDPEFLSRVYGVKVERIERPERPHKPLVFPVGPEERDHAKS